MAGVFEVGEFGDPLLPPDERVSLTSAAKHCLAFPALTGSISLQ